jgi:hypothetical protein
MAPRRALLQAARQSADLEVAIDRPMDRERRLNRYRFRGGADPIRVDAQSSRTGCRLGVAMIGDVIDRCGRCAMRPERVTVIDRPSGSWLLVACRCGVEMWIHVAGDSTTVAEPTVADRKPIPTAGEIATMFDTSISDHEKIRIVFGVVCRLAAQVGESAR